MPDRLFRVDDAVVGQQAPALQKGEVRLQVLCSLPGQPVFRACIERELERLRNLHGNLVLHGEDVSREPIEPHRPDVGTRLGVYQLRRHPHASWVALDAALEQEARTQLSADLSRVRLPAAECKRRGARDHIELGEARQLVQDRFGDAGREDLAIGRGAQVLERQHGDRHTLRTRGAEVRLPHEQHRNRGQQHADDRDIGVAAQSVDDRARHALRRGIARYAPITGFVEPGERDGHWKAEYRGDDQRDHHPPWHAQRLERDVGDLQQQPGDDRIAHRDADDTSLAQAMQPTRTTAPAMYALQHTCSRSRSPSTVLDPCARRADGPLAAPDAVDL